MSHSGASLAIRRTLIAYSLTLAFALSVSAGNNALSPREVVDGYELLWNGLDFSGWKLNSSQHDPGDPALATNWIIVQQGGVESGDRHASVDADSNVLEIAAAGSAIFTADSSFRDFDWKVEWKLPESTQAFAQFVYYFDHRITTDFEYSGTQFPIMNPSWTSLWKSKLTTAGTNYDMIPLLPSRRNADLSPSWTRAAGQWNESRIISYGSRAAHYGNGLRLLEFDKLSPVYDSAYRLSKFRAKGTYYPQVHAGSFLLADRGQRHIMFRNLRVKRLTRNPWGADSPYLDHAAAARGDTSLIDTLPMSENLFPQTTGIRPGNRDRAPRAGTRGRDALGRAGIKAPRGFFFRARDDGAISDAQPSNR